jgi:hypothetical protein
MEAGKSRLQADTVRDATRAEVDGFRRENEQLKQLVAELSLEVLVLKKQPSPTSTEAEVSASGGLKRQP